MKKAELIDQMAQDAGITKAAATAAIESLLDGITGALKKKDGKVALAGFGTFSKTRRKARSGRNPRTGETIKIKASDTVRTEAAKQKKMRVWLAWRRLQKVWINELELRSGLRKPGEAADHSSSTGSRSAF
jgi:DNA-binding protein HU-beta